VIGYLRVSTDEQGESGAGREAQRAVIATAALGRGWSVEYVTEVASGGKADRHPMPKRVKRRLVDLAGCGGARRWPRRSGFGS